MAGTDRLATFLQLCLCAVCAGLKGSCDITFLNMKFLLMQPSFRVSCKQPKHRASFGTKAPVPLLVA